MRAVLGTELRERLGTYFEESVEPLYVWQRDGDGELVLAGFNAAAAAVPDSATHQLLGRRARDVYGDVVPQVLVDLEACAEQGSLQREIDYVFPSSGVARRLLVSYTRVAPDLVVVATRDITGVWERARQERQRIRELEQLAEMTQALLDCDDPQQSRDVLCSTALALAEADAVYLLEPQGDDLVQTAGACASGRTVHEPIRQTVDARSVSGEVYRTRQRAFMADVHTDPRGSAAAADVSGMQSGLFEPVQVGERVLGVLVVAWAHPSPAPPQRAARIMPVLASQAGSVVLRTDLIARLTDLAGKDSLTGLPNRRSWDEEVERTLALARRHHNPVCVVVLDVNGLKEVNDGQGHQAGDDLLRESARVWQGQLRAEDFLARLGGDEFGVLVPGLRETEAQRIVGRLTAAAPDVSAAAGVAEWDGRESAQELLHRADAAMYRHKRAR